MTTRSWAWARVGVLALLWGSTFLWIRLALDGLPPVEVTVVRCLLGTLVLAALCLARRQRLPDDRATWRHLLVAAFFCNALPFTLISIGEQTVGSGLAGVLNATTPLWSLLIGLVTGAERRLPPLRSGGLLLGFGGTVIVCAPWQQGHTVGWGAVAVLGAAASYAVAFSYMQRHLVGRGVPTLALSTAQLLAATGLTALTLPVGGHLRLQVAPTTLIAVVVLGILTTGVTFHLTFRIIADEGATDAATVGYLLPVVSVALGALVLGEALSLRTVAGMAVVVGAVAMTRRRPRTTAETATTPTSAPMNTAATAPPTPLARPAE